MMKSKRHLEKFFSAQPGKCQNCQWPTVANNLTELLADVEVDIFRPWDELATRKKENTVVVVG